MKDIAPEIAAGGNNTPGHGLPVDWWSLGCVIFECVAGRAPFGDSADLPKFEIFNNINAGKIRYPLSMSSSLKSLLRGLLDKNTSTRFKMKDVREHPWMKCVDWDATMNLCAVPPWIPSTPDEGEHSNFIDWSSKACPEPPRVVGEGASYCDFKLRRGGGRSRMGIASSANLKVKMRKRLAQARENVTNNKKNTNSNPMQVGMNSESSKKVQDTRKRPTKKLSSQEAAERAGRKWKAKSDSKKKSAAIAPRLDG